MKNYGNFFLYLISIQPIKTKPIFGKKKTERSALKWMNDYFVSSFHASPFFSEELCTDIMALCRLSQITDCAKRIKISLLQTLKAPEIFDSGGKEVPTLAYISLEARSRFN